MKKKTTAQLKKVLWELCKQIIRKKFSVQGINVCYTCGRYDIQGRDCQTGHGKNKSILSLKYQFDLRNLRTQCNNCNVNRNGMTDIFINKLEKEKEGLEFLQEACIKTENGWEVKHLSPMGSIEAYIFVTEKIKEYEKLLQM